MAAGRSAILSVKILVDTAKAGADIDRFSGKFASIQNGLSKLAVPAAVALGAIGAFGKSAVDSASRVQQAYGGLDAVFGANAKIVRGWAQDSAQAVGLSKAEYSEFAARLGAQLKTLTGDSQVAMSGTKNLISLGADLAATFGGTTADAVDALSAALRGEADPAERYGLNLSMTAVNARLAEKGLTGLKGQALTAAKAQAVMELATEQSAGAIGQFARESDSAAGSAQIAAAKWEDTRAALGEALLPVVSAVTTMLGNLAAAMGRNSGATVAVVGAIAGLAAAILVANGALKVYNIVQGVMAAKAALAAAGTWKLNAALLANPIGLVVAAVVALIAGLVLLYQKNEAFRNFVQSAWQAIANAITTAWEWIKSTVTSVIDFLTPYIQTAGQIISTVWNSIRDAAIWAWNLIRDGVSQVIAAIMNAIAPLLPVISAIWNGIQTAATIAWNIISNVVGVAISVILTIVRTLLPAISAIWNAVKAVVEVVWNLIIGVITTAIGVIGTIIRGIVAVATTVWNTVRTVATTVWNAIRAVVQTVVTAIGNILRGIIAVATNVWNTVRNAATTAWNGIRSVVNGVMNGIRSVVQNVGNALSGVWNSIRGTASSAFNGLRAVALSALNAILAPIRAIKSAFDSVVGAVRNVINAIGRIKMPKISLPFGLGRSVTAPANMMGARTMIAGAAAPRASLTDALGRMGRPSLAASAGGITIINVSGTLNDTDSARAVRRVLRNDSRHRAGVSIG